ncbi:MAG TPA: tetratricopeptide repeat protein [Polyangiaceae bacterium]
MVRSVNIARALLGMALIGCGGGNKPASSPDEVVPLEDSAANRSNPGAKAAGAEQASSPDVAEAMKAIEAKQFDKAKTLLTTAIQKNPKDAQAHYYMGVALASAGGDSAKAIESLEKAIALDPKLVDAYVNLSALKLEAKDAAGALAAADKGLAIAKKQPDLALNRALALEALGKKTEAVSAYADAVAARPEDCTLRVSYAQLLAQAAKKTEALGQISAIRECKDTRLLAVAANVARQLGASADCVATLDAALKLEAHAALFVRRGMCREDLKDVAGATQDYKQAIERDAKFPPAHYYYGLTLKASDKPKACKELALAADLGGEQGIGPEAKKAKAELNCK